MVKRSKKAKTMRKIIKAIWIFNWFNSCGFAELVPVVGSSWNMERFGMIIVGFVDKESELGKRYQLKGKKSKFYKDATFYTAMEVIEFLRKTNFENVDIRQTVFPSRTGRIESVEDGYGKGSYVIIKAIKQTNF